MIVRELTEKLELGNSWIRRYEDGKKMARIIWTTIILQAYAKHGQIYERNAIGNKARKYYENYNTLE